MLPNPKPTSQSSAANSAAPLRLARPGLYSSGRARALASDVEILNRMYLGEEGGDLSGIPVVMARVRVSVAEMKACLSLQWKGRGCSLDVAERNKAYLEYARLVSCKVLSGETYRLIELRLTMEEVEFFAGLTYGQIEYLANAMEGEIATSVSPGKKIDPSDQTASIYWAASAVTAFRVD